MKAIKFKENDYYSVTLPKGVYTIDGVIVDIESYAGGNVQVKDLNSVRLITRNNVIDHYLNPSIEKDNILSTDKYKETELYFLSFSECGEDGFRTWTSLEDEFNYKKFKEIWKPIYKNIELLSDPFSFEIVESVIDSGCPYIISDYLNGGNNPILFIYNRISAVLSIVNNKFKELGMEYKPDISYANTKNRKIWGNSSHSVIRYVTAFNTYIFNDKWGSITNIRGDLDKLLLQFNKDKEEIENIIQTEYNIHFGKIDQNEFNFEELLRTLKTIRNDANSVVPKTSTYDNYRRMLANINDAIKQVEESYKTE